MRDKTKQFFLNLFETAGMLLCRAFHGDAINYNLVTGEYECPDCNRHYFAYTHEYRPAGK